VVAIGAGVAARSVLLIGFGLDSVIELVSACLLLWRLTAEGRTEALQLVERMEHWATWLAAVLLFLLVLYLVVSSVVGLVIRFEPENAGWVRMETGGFELRVGGEEEVVPAEGLEPPTPRSEVWCSDPLSYAGTPR
jgi:hypothetical protein